MKDKDKKNALNEIRMLASLSHPNVINYHEAFLDEKTNYLNIVMELAMNGDLASKIKQKFQNGEGFFEFEIWKIVSGILKGLKYLHNAQIVHRDLKPANVFFGENNIVKLGDLNVSRILNNTDLAHTQTGTPNYASP